MVTIGAASISIGHHKGEVGVTDGPHLHSRHRCGKDCSVTLVTARTCLGVATIPEGTLHVRIGESVLAQSLSIELKGAYLLTLNRSPEHNVRSLQVVLPRHSGSEAEVPASVRHIPVQVVGVEWIHSGRTRAAS